MLVLRSLCRMAVVGPFRSWRLSVYGDFALGSPSGPRLYQRRGLVVSARSGPHFAALHAALSVETRSGRRVTRIEL